jgi:hypothetical protein
MAAVKKAQRPELQASLACAEFRRWYWLKRELQEFASRLGMRGVSSLGKDELSKLICAALDGQPVDSLITEPANRKRSNAAVDTGARLTSKSLIPGPPCLGKRTRAYFMREVGSDFKFNAHMREYLSRNAGQRTLGEALAHYHETKHIKPQSIGAQFEYNQFSRDWREGKMRDVPEYNGLTLREAWALKRSLPKS